MWVALDRLKDFPFGLRSYRVEPSTWKLLSCLATEGRSISLTITEKSVMLIKSTLAATSPPLFGYCGHCGKKTILKLFFLECWAVYGSRNRGESVEKSFFFIQKVKSESTIELSAILPCFNSNNEHYLPNILIFAFKRASMAPFARSPQYSTLSSTSIYKYTLPRLPSPVGSVCIRVDSLLWCWVSIECRWWLLGNYSVSSFLLLRAGDNDYTRSHCFLSKIDLPSHSSLTDSCRQSLSGYAVCRLASVVFLKNPVSLFLGAVATKSVESGAKKISWV